MLSILIPEYNYNCTKLVKDLAGQCIKAGLTYEILVMDDASTSFKPENRNISTIPCCSFIESDHNMGSPVTRNNMVKLAKYDHLMIIDCDMEVCDERFIQRYLDVIGKAPVVIGGSTYSDKKPDFNKLLRWHYGRNRECIPASMRNQHPWRSLITQNLMIEKEILEKYPFQQFSDYGHDDTLLGYTFKINQIPILHIDNQLKHNGLDSNEQFLAKSLKAVEKYITVPEFKTAEAVEDIKIFRVFKKISNLGLNRILAFAFNILKKSMRKYLCGKHPSLFLFDFYRLGYLCQYAESIQKWGK